MSVSSGRSRVTELTFQVFGRIIHPDWFRVEDHQRIQRQDWKADLRIIEGGHAITWSTGRSRLTEVLCQNQLRLPERGLLFRESVRHERSATLRQGVVAEYQTCFDVEWLGLEVFRHLCSELTSDAAKGLYHQIRSTNRFTPSPLSFIRVDARQRGLSVQAFHTFPEEQAIVRTQSLFEVLAATSC